MPFAPTRRHFDACCADSASISSRPVCAGSALRGRGRPRGRASAGGPAPSGSSAGEGRRGPGAPGGCRGSWRRWGRSRRRCPACRGRPARPCGRERSANGTTVHSSPSPKPCSSSALLTAWRSVHRPSTSSRRRVTTSQVKPKSSRVHRDVGPVGVALDQLDHVVLRLLVRRPVGRAEAHRPAAGRQRARPRSPGSPRRWGPGRASRGRPSSASSVR